MNPEHVDIVKRNRINSWRIDNPGIKLDLNRADLNGIDLNHANLAEADLRRSNLAGTKLIGANLTGANLDNANLTLTNLISADLSWASMAHATLLRAVLMMSDVFEANLFEADLRLTNFFKADLRRTDLRGANLTSANLVMADLRGAKLTGANLYGTGKDDWNIGGVICDYIFWDSAGKDRSPKDRNLRRGEFERLYAQLPTIEYVFENGLHPLDHVIMDRIVQAINEKNPEFELKIDSLNTRGIYPTITFNVKYEEQKTEAFDAISQAYDLRYENAELKGEIRGLLAGMDRLAGQPLIKDSVVALPGGQINIQEYIGHLQEIQQTIEEAPAETLPESARKEALDTVAEAGKDFASRKVKEGFERITKLGLDIVTKTPAYEALKDLAERAF